MIYDNILETIGNTPLVRINKLYSDLPGTFAVKLETFNPGHSTKDRMALKMIEDAEASGASISQVLKDQSIQMRLERFVRAEKAGARASQMILVPLMIFILPAVFVMVFGPVVVSFMYGGGL